MKIIFRNLVSIIRRFKAAWIMNVLGVSAALTALMFVAMQIQYETNFDTCHKDADRVFRLTMEDVPYPFSMVFSRPNIEIAGNISPKVEAYSLSSGSLLENSVEVENKDGEINGFNVITCAVDPGFVKVFTFETINGDPECLNTPGNAYIPESTALKFFGTTDVIGRVIKLSQKYGTNDGTITIGAVYKDFPSNTQTNNHIYFSINDIDLNEQNNRNYLGWLKLSSPEDKEEIEELMKTQIVKLYNDETDYKLLALPEIFYKNESGETLFTKSGSRQVTATLAIIAIIVLIISMINHTNLSIAMIPMRIRSICTQKIIGANVATLRRNLYAEAVLMGVFCWLLSLLFVKLLGGTWITQFFTPDDLSITGNLGICLAAGAVAVVISVVASIFPITKMTSISPALAVKGTFGNSQSGRRLRTVLLLFQFFAAISFITIAVCIRKQINYMDSSNQILSNNQIAVFKINRTFAKQYDAVLASMKEFPGIENVAFSLQEIGGTDTFTHNVLVSAEGDTVIFQTIIGTSEITDVFGIGIAEGPGFSVGRTDGDPIFDWYRGEAVFTPEIRSRIGKGLGGQIQFDDDNTIFTIKGITDSDVRVTSYRMASEPLMFVLCGYGHMGYAYVRLAKGCNVNDALRHIESVVDRFAPGMPLDIEFYDKIFQKLYKQEINISATTTFLAILAVLISMIGVFSMVMFDMEYKRREIAVRKVFGASSSQILQSVNLRYPKLILAAFALSVPISIYVIINWQKSFVVKADLSWWIFAIVALCVMAVTALIVTLQSAKAIYSNPIESLKNE